MAAKVITPSGGGQSPKIPDSRQDPRGALRKEGSAAFLDDINGGTARIPEYGVYSEQASHSPPTQPGGLNPVYKGHPASNAYGVLVARPFQGTGGQGSGNVGAKTYHGLSIVINGITLGRLQNWTPNIYTRGGTHIFGLGKLNYGRPVDYVPGKGENYSITASRAELWYNEIDRLATGAHQMTDLVSQRDPFTIYETLFKGDNPYRVWSYNTCWWSELNHAPFDAKGDGKVTTNIGINFVSRMRML